LLSDGHQLLMLVSGYTAAYGWVARRGKKYTMAVTRMDEMIATGFAYSYIAAPCFHDTFFRYVYLEERGLKEIKSSPKG
jgi:hypothetical protein